MKALEVSMFKVGDKVVLKNGWLFVNIFKIEKIEKNDNGLFAYFTNGFAARLTSIRHANCDDDWRRNFGESYV